MNYGFCFFIIIFFVSSSVSFCQKKNTSNVCEDWNKLDSLITNQIIDSEEAIDLMKEYEPIVKNYFRRMKGLMVRRSDWVFPLRNFTSIYYRDYGNDYIVKLYDYFQGSNSKGHPAHDIMILDLNKDLLDDSTLMPVDVVSMSSGVVVAADTTWKTGSQLRGGLYVKIFDVTNSGIFYYSHLSKVSVKPGEVVNPGDKIGEVGRTGRKAIMPQGKTHLHVAFFNSVDGYPQPVDIIVDLRNAEENLSTKKR